MIVCVGDYIGELTQRKYGAQRKAAVVHFGCKVTKVRFNKID
jgi:hypothetical protein